MNNIKETAVNAIRILSAEGVQAANSGHPGLPMGAAPAAFALWAENMVHNSSNPKWENRDRFVLSAGHGSMLMYSLLHLFNYGLKIDDLKNFRQMDSKTPGHPEFGHTVGIEVTTGPLGQGIANAVGFAMAEKHLAAKFNKDDLKIVDHYTYTLMGDGCMMEGISGEASSLAGTLGLGKLIAIYDDNEISIEGNTDISFREDVQMRYKAYGWQVIDVADGNDIEAISAAIKEAKKDTEHPSLVVCHTQIGFGCPAKQGKHSAHGEPLGKDNLIETKKNLGWPVDKDFYVPQEVYDFTAEVTKKGQQAEENWKKTFAEYEKKYPEMAQQYQDDFAGKLPDLWNDAEMFDFEGATATRASSGTTINRLAKKVPNLFGGSADLAPSTKTLMNGQGDFSKETPEGKNLHFGVREHAMAAIGNGIALHGGLRPYVSTFFVFSDYLKPSVRLSAMMKQSLVYVLTHDSIGVGEDGPTHQPIEQLASLRSIPGMTVMRPADSKETAASWIYALEADGPTALVLTRQNLPLYDSSSPEGVKKGAYILSDSDKAVPDVLLLASGSEVELCMNAKAELKAKGIDARVVSMPSFEAFEKQSAEYKESVIPNAVRARVGVEAASSFGWYKYIGLDGEMVCMNGFGASGPAEEVFERFGIVTESVVEAAVKTVGKSK
ncbi:MAG: transketolase [Clostridia bacterium]|nr:transketolase [Clostridia bacterium]